MEQTPPGDRLPTLRAEPGGSSWGKRTRPDPGPSSPSTESSLPCADQPVTLQKNAKTTSVRGVDLIDPMYFITLGYNFGLQLSLNLSISVSLPVKREIVTTTSKICCVK